MKRPRRLARLRAIEIRRTGVTEYSAAGPDHSGLMPANLITLAHFSVSSAMSLPKSAGEPASTVPPNSASRAFILGSAIAALAQAQAIRWNAWQAHWRERFRANRHDTRCTIPEFPHRPARRGAALTCRSASSSISCRQCPPDRRKPCILAKESATRFRLWNRADHQAVHASSATPGRA